MTIRSKTMTRREFAATAILAPAALALGATPARPAAAASGKEIDVGADATLQSFYAKVQGGKDFVAAAKGVLIFPSIFQAGIGIGGSYGEGVLRMTGQPPEYYSSSQGSVGIQLGAQTSAMIICFMQQPALDVFRASSGWTAGVDGSVALVNVGAGGVANTNTAQTPIVYFVFDNTGLMFNLSIAGTKFEHITR
jgi:lipid-binding SYLF domain-containing protein